MFNDSKPRVKVGDTLYRAYAVLDCELFSISSHSIEFIEYRVAKVTPCGYWINIYGYPKNLKFINTKWKKQYAWPTKELAVESTLIRSIIRRDKLEASLKCCEYEIESLKQWKGNHHVG